VSILLKISLNDLAVSLDVDLLVSFDVEPLWSVDETYCMIAVNRDCTNWSDAEVAESDDVEDVDDVDEVDEEGKEDVLELSRSTSPPGGAP